MTKERTRGYKRINLQAELNKYSHQDVVELEDSIQLPEINNLYHLRTDSHKLHLDINISKSSQSKGKSNVLGSSMERLQWSCVGVKQCSVTNCSQVR